MRWAYTLFYQPGWAGDADGILTGVFRSADQAGRYLRSALAREGFNPNDPVSWRGYWLKEWDLDRLLEPRVIEIPGRPSMDGRPVRRRST